MWKKSTRIQQEEASITAGAETFTAHAGTGLGGADPLLSYVYYTGLFLGLTEAGIVLKAFEKINACIL